jgi:hypothetical protein
MQVVSRPRAGAVENRVEAPPNALISGRERSPSGARNVLANPAADVDKRGSKARGQATLEAWLKVLDGSFAASDCPRLVQP